MSLLVHKRNTFCPTRSGFGGLILQRVNQRSKVARPTPIRFAASSVEIGLIEMMMHRSLIFVKPFLIAAYFSDWQYWAGALEETFFRKG